MQKMPSVICVMMVLFSMIGVAGVEACVNGGPKEVSSALFELKKTMRGEGTRKDKMTR